MITKFISTCILISILLWHETVLASSSAHAIINWNSVSFQLFDLSAGKNAPVLNWNSKSGLVTSYATSAEPYDYDETTRSSFGFSKYIIADSETEYAQSNGIRNDISLNAEAFSEAVETVQVDGVNSAYSSAENSGFFSLSGAGWLLITMDWSVFSSGIIGHDMGAGLDEYAGASVSINGFYNGLFNSGSARSDYSTISDNLNNSDPVFKNGVFSMGFMNPGVGTTTGYLSAIATAFASSRAYVASSETKASNEYSSADGEKGENIEVSDEQTASDGNSGAYHNPSNQNNPLDETLSYQMLGVNAATQGNDATSVLSENSVPNNIVKRTDNTVPEPNTIILIGIGSILMSTLSKKSCYFDK